MKKGNRRKIDKRKSVCKKEKKDKIRVFCRMENYRQILYLYTVENVVLPHTPPSTP